MNTPNNTYWNTRDGKRLLIADMDIDHVKHCVSLLTRQLGHQFIAYGYCSRIRLCELLTAAQQEATLSTLTDPNQQESTNDHINRRSFIPISKRLNRSP